MPASICATFAAAAAADVLVQRDAGGRWRGLERHHHLRRPARADAAAALAAAQPARAIGAAFAARAARGLRAAAPFAASASTVAASASVHTAAPSRPASTFHASIAGRAAVAAARAP